MKIIPIKNPDVLEGLNNFLWYYENKSDLQLNHILHGANQSYEKWVDEDEKALNKVMMLGNNHDGYPECLRAYPIKADRLSFKNNDAEYQRGFYERWNKYNSNMTEILSAKNNALGVVYPPGGFISWHNNANACAYNLVFTWSETGEGDFRYVDGKTGETVICHDEPGWTCKAGYFGHYGEPAENLVYHAAKTDCWRMTISYIFDRSQMSLGLQDDVIEEIMSEF